MGEKASVVRDVTRYVVIFLGGLLLASQFVMFAIDYQLQNSFETILTLLVGSAGAVLSGLLVRFVDEKLFPELNEEKE